MKSWKYILIVVFCVLCGVFIAEILNGIQKPVYRSHGLMEIKTRAPWKGLSDGQYRMVVNEIIATECKKITSYPIIKEAVDSLQIPLPPLNPSTPPFDKGGKGGFLSEDKNRILRLLQKHISAGRIKGTNIIQITASYNNPKKVAQIINNILEIYIKKKAEEKENYEAGNPAGEQLEKVKNVLKKDREKLRILSEKQGFINNSELLETKLVDLRLDFAKLSRRYSERHPQIIDLKEQIKVTENQLSLSSKKDQLIKKIKINEELYNTFNSTQLNGVDNGADMVGKLSIIAFAIEPILPIKPKKELNLSAGGFIGFLFGLFFSFRTRSKEISLKDIEKIETNFKIPVIGIIPRIKDVAKSNFSFWNLKPTKKTDKLVELQNRLLLYYSTKSSVTEAYYTLWANIRFALQEKQGRALLFTSADSKEGKTLTAVNYAIANAMAGIKTLLVEADSIKPLIYKIFNLPKGPGLHEVIIEDMNWKGMLKDFNPSSLKSRNLDCLKIITYGKESNTPIDILTSKKIEKFIEEVKQEFGLVIFDCSPLLLSAESVILSGKVDDVILVYRPGKVQPGLLNRAKIQLENIRANILGIVLNNIKTSEIYPHYAYYPGKYLGKSEANQEKVPVKQRTKRVLIIDDESSIVNVITRMLLKKSKFKYEIASASDGITALKQLDLFNPHLVILDLKLPGIDGFQICKKIRSDLQKKNMKILAITGYDDPDTKERILSYGADEYLTKPFDINKFMECVDKLPC